MAPDVTGRPHVLVVAKAFPPSGMAESHVTAKLVYSLLQAGARVTVIASDRWSGPHAGLSRLMSHPELSVERTRSYTNPAVKFLVHLFYSVRERAPIGPAYFIHAGLRLFRRHHVGAPDLVYARGLPSHSYFLGARIARECGAPLVLHISDPWPRKLWPPPYRRGPDIPELWETVASAKLFQQTAAITFPSRRLRDHLLNGIPPLRQKPTCILPHSTPPFDVPPSGFRLTQARRDGRMEIVHGGTLDDHRTPLPFLIGFRHFLHAHPDAAHLTFIGARWEKLPGMIQDLGLTNHVTLVGPLDYLESLDAFRSADVLLLVEAASEGIFLPSKLADYCWAGRPIIAISPTNGEVADYLAGIGSAVTPPGSPPEEFVRALSACYEAWRHNPESLPNPSALCRHFDGGQLAKCFLEFSRGL